MSFNIDTSRLMVFFIVKLCHLVYYYYQGNIIVKKYCMIQLYVFLIIKPVKRIGERYLFLFMLPLV